MKQSEAFLNNLLNRLLPNRAAPVLGKVIKAHTGSGKTKYSVDVQVLQAGNLEETDRIIAEVPISPIWATKKKRGVYAIPDEGVIVIVEFLQWDLAYPYVSGIYSDEYDADKFFKDQFIITCGDGMVVIINAQDNSITLDNSKDCFIRVEPKKITLNNGKIKAILKGDKCAITNNSQDLFTILDTHFQNVHDLLIGILPLGVPPTHCVTLPDKLKIQKDKFDLGEIMEKGELPEESKLWR